MLVTCPECGTKISDQADPCPKCGLRCAGAKSKEYNEEIARSCDETMADNQYHQTVLSCSNCGFKGDNWGKQRAEARKSEDNPSYYVVCFIRCPKCKRLLSSFQDKDGKTTVWAVVKQYNK